MYARMNDSELEEELLAIVLKNQYVYRILNCNPFPEGEPWYVAAGGVVQSVWNHLSGKEITHGIKDYDLIYFDKDLSKDTESAHIKRIRTILSDVDVEIDVVNEARVHLWFHEYFETRILPYSSCEEAIASWNPLAAVGITKRNGTYDVCAPFGLRDTFDMIMRPNKSHFPKHAYEAKSAKWKAKWNTLHIIDWDAV